MDNPQLDFENATIRELLLKAGASSRYLEEILMAMAGGLVVMDQGGHIVFANLAAASLAGFTDSQEFLNPSLNMADVFDFFDEHGKTLALSELPGRKALAGVACEDMIVRWRNKQNGEERWVQIKATPIKDESGKVLFAVNAFHDLTKQKEIEENLNVINRRNRHILESITDGFYALDRNLCVTFINKQAEPFFYNLDVVGKSIREIYPDLNSKGPLFISKLEQVLNENQTMHFEEYYKTLDKWLEFSMYPSKDGIAVYFRDITARKKSNEIEQYNTLLLQNTSDAVISTDLDYQIKTWNKAAEALYGFTTEEVLNRNIWNVTPNLSETSQWLNEVQNRIFYSGSWKGEVLQKTKDGRDLNILSSISAIKNYEGQIIGWVAINRDITNLKKTEAINAELAAIVDSSDDAIVSKNLNGIIISWNHGAENVYGYTADEVIGRHMEILSAPGHTDDSVFIVSHVKTGSSLEHYETKRRRKSGEIIDVSVTASPIKSRSGQLIGFSVISRDITRQKAYENALKESEDKFRAMIENTSDGIILLDKSANIMFASKAAERILGYNETELSSMNVAQIIHPENLGQMQESFSILLTKSGLTTSSLYRYISKDGKYHWVEVVSTNFLDHPSIKAVVSNFRDITERKKVEETLRYQYHHDSLTDLPNRTYLNEKFVEALNEADANRKSVALMLLDLDRFKQINESLGHAIGDRLIQEVALRIRSCVKENHILVRLGGDEFGILMPDVELEGDAAQLASKILEDFRPAFYLDKHELFISPSIGISMYPYDGKEPAVLFRNAEAALYRAKDHGRNTYQFYTTTMNAAAFERLTMESKLRHAIENEEFVLFYQPQVDVRTGKIVGTEELIRWQRPDMSLVSPDRFIPLVEANGLIEEIGEWVVRKSLAQAKTWHNQGFKLYISINLSPRQFKQKNFEHRLIDIIDESKIDPKFIEFELTESVLAENTEHIMHIMHALRDRGVRFCLDDFSTGYSSLRYIKQFPVDMIKIERNFMKGIPLDVQNSAIAKSIITLGRSLDMEITAEGVESKQQLAFLLENSCHRAQGYLFNGAMPAHSLSEILGEDRYVSVVTTLPKN